MNATFDQVKNKLDNFDKRWANEHINIYHREDIVTATLLTYCSVCRFMFQNRVLPRGWLDILVIGDTRCGKTEAVRRTLNEIQLGEMFVCENVSFAGLVGGLKQNGNNNKYDMSWGKLPMNNGRLVVCDEMSGLDLDDIGRLSGVRSSGIAEINKISAGATKARTRIIWISNPRAPRAEEAIGMAHFQYGVDAVQGLIGRPEDIARFDFAIAVRNSDVPIDVTNKVHEVSTWEPPAKELRALIAWSWSLTPTDVEIGTVTEEAILKAASKQAHDYAWGIPLVEPNEQRIKVARVAVAVAVRCFSEKDGKLVVLPAHVEYADYFMRKCFDSEGLGYKAYSRSEKRAESDNTEAISIISNAFAEVIPIAQARLRGIRMMQRTANFGVNDFEALFNLTRPEARGMLSLLLQYGCVIKSAQNYRKTPLGIKVLDYMMEAIGE